MTTRDLPERRFYLVMLASGPAVWLLHFLVTYTTVAVRCGPRGTATATLALTHGIVGTYTAVALAGIAGVAWSGWTRHRHGDETRPYDMDTPEDRHRFLGFATFLLALLSAVATLFVAGSTLLMPDCR